MLEISVLLVEDEQMLERVVGDALRTIGLAYETAPSGDEALQRLQQRRYDLMIVDLRLRLGSGIAVMQQARQLYPELPVILITAYAATEELQRALAIGVDAVLYKPFDIDTLLATVRRLLCARRTMLLATQGGIIGIGSGLSCWLRAGGFATLESGAVVTACRVLSVDEHLLSVETEQLEPPYPARWTLRWTGSDGVYSFGTRVVECVKREDTLCWLLRMPKVIHRVQRRRHPRLQVRGRAVVSIAGRPQRVLEAELVNVSVEGACVTLPEPPLRNTSVYVDAQASTELGTLAFQREGTVRSVVAFTELGAPRYRVGIHLQPLPSKARQLLRALRRQRLIAP
ncbi:MAG: response regulator [Armatimonadota bacterium]|nr:response regulator [Armatimonadota bacterium]